MSDKAQPTAAPCCSFCGRPRYDVFKLIAGPENVAICDECAILSVCIAAEEEAKGGTWQGKLESVQDRLRSEIFQVIRIILDSEAAE